MSDSIRQQIIDKIDARFKTIKIAAGYKTDTGKNVYDWLDRDLASAEMPALIYRDTNNEVTPHTMRQYQNVVVLEIELKAETAAATPNTLREMVEDVYKAIGTDDRWSGLAIDTQPKNEKMNVQHGDKIIGVATITIEIEYETAKWEY